MAIKLNGIEFDGPYELNSFGFPKVAGIYAILTPSGLRVGNYNVIYIGESGDFSERVSDQHEHYNCWKRKANSKLFVALYKMKEVSEVKRRELETRLIEFYQPSCNIQSK